jgi:hypothetical protein
MSTAFSTLKTNVGNRVGDTSSTFATIIGTYINQRYKDVLRRTNFYSINPDYAITATSASTVTSASTYKLPSDFGKELYVWNSSTTQDIPYLSLEKLEQEYQDTLASTGTVEYYSIFTTKDTSAASAEASAARVKKIRFYRAPSTDNYFTIPYVMSPADLSGDTDQLTFDCERAVEYGATSDAWMYKRQMGKARYFEALYEKEIQNLMWDEANQPNQIHMMNPMALNRDEGM